MFSVVGMWSFAWLLCLRGFVVVWQLVSRVLVFFFFFGGYVRVDASFPMILGEVLSVFRFSWWML